MYDVAIIGEGVVGGQIARELSRYKLSVCILEKEADVATGATRANSGIVHAGFDAKEGTLKARLNVQGSKMMKEVCGDLGVPYINNGSLVIGFGDKDMEQIKALYNRGIVNGVEKLEILSKSQLERIEPNISKNAIGALFAPTGAIVSPYELAIASIGNAMDNGAELKLNFKVNSIKFKGEVYHISSDNESVCARYVVNAAGVHSDYIAGLAGDNSFKITPRKGEYMLLDKVCGHIVSHTIFRTPSEKGKGILVSPTVDGNLILGPTSVDIDDKEDNSTTAEGLDRIRREVCENVENIPLSKVITSFCGLRATGSTGDFIIDIKNRFVNVAGIESPGLTAAPAIAKYVAQILKNNSLELQEKEGFNPKRRPMHYFSMLTTEEKNKLIKENPSYGKIVCRCEMVSEGEIIDAIRTNPKAATVDGVKFRTRSGAGRCQGGFCSPSVVEILARELKTSVLDITKSGGNTNILICKTKGGGLN